MRSQTKTVRGLEETVVTKVVEWVASYAAAKLADNALSSQDKQQTLAGKVRSFFDEVYFGWYKNSYGDIYGKFGQASFLDYAAVQEVVLQAAFLKATPAIENIKAAIEASHYDGPAVPDDVILHFVTELHSCFERDLELQQFMLVREQAEVLSRIENHSRRSAERIEQLLQLREASVGTREIWYVPHLRNPYFTGREEYLDNLKRDLQVHPIRGVVGLGGVGKTQLALEYAYRYRNQYSSVIWLRAESVESLTTDLLSCPLGLQFSRICTEPAQVLRAINVWFNQNANWLLIFDNADRPSIIREFIPTGGTGKMLVTSRLDMLDNVGIRDPTKLQVFTEDEARVFFKMRCAPGQLTVEDTAALDELIGVLQGLPLALEQAAAYIARLKCSFSEYLVSYQRRGLELLEQCRPLAGEYSESVATTWLLNFKAVSEANKASADLFTISAFLSPDSIPLELFKASHPYCGTNLANWLSRHQEDPLSLDELLAPLTDLSLIRRNPSSDSFDVHRLVQLAMRATLTVPEERSWAETVVKVLDTAFPAPEFENWVDCERLVTHVAATVPLIKQNGIHLLEAGDLLNKTGVYLLYCGRFKEAESFLLEALEVFDRVVGENHEQTASVLNNLALIYKITANFENSIKLYAKSLEIRTRLFGSESIQVAESLNNLAMAVAETRDLQKAKELCEQSLELRKRILGPDHRDIGQSTNNLGLIMYKQGHYSAAGSLYRHALAISEKNFGKEHPQSLITLDNLAAVLCEQQQFDEAVQAYEDAVRLREKVLGHRHPDLGVSLSNLGQAYLKVHDFTRAAESLKRALQIFRDSLGDRHPNVGQCLNNLGNLLYRQKKYKKAEPLLREALEIKEGAYGGGHPEVALTLNNLANCYDALGQLDKAEELHRRALAIRLQVLGPEHPFVALTMERYAHVLYQKGESERADELMREAQRIRAKKRAEPVVHEGEGCD